MAHSIAAAAQSAARSTLHHADVALTSISLLSTSACSSRPVTYSYPLIVNRGKVASLFLNTLFKSDSRALTWQSVSVSTGLVEGQWMHRFLPCQRKRKGDFTPLSSLLPPSNHPVPVSPASSLVYFCLFPAKNVQPKNITAQG